MQKTYCHGLSTAQHDKVDSRRAFPHVYDAIRQHRHGLIVDLFSGGGRDIATCWNELNGDGRFIAVDADRQRINDMLDKNKAGITPFTDVRSKGALDHAFADKKIAVIQGTLPHQPFGNTGIDLTQKADVVLCLAGIMFIPPQELDATLAQCAALLNHGGDMVLQFSLEREERHTHKNYHIHAPATVINTLANNGLAVTRTPDHPDALGRSFSWVEILAHRP